MSSEVYKGIVIRETPYGDSNKILNILTKEKGVITAGALGARKPGRNMLSSTSIIAFSEFELSGSESTKYYIKGASLIESFERIKNDIVLLTYSAHLCDIVLDTVRGTESSEEIYRLVLYTLAKLSEKSKNPDLIIHTFELKLLFILGYTPVLDECCVCKEKIDPDQKDFLFSHEACGIICGKKKCFAITSKNNTISSSVYRALGYISRASIEKVFSFQLSPDTIKELASFSSRYISERLEKSYNKLKMLEQL
jgi:DNA repair protein RecO (recombination protein O)